MSNQLSIPQLVVTTRDTDLRGLARPLLELRKINWNDFGFLTTYDVRLHLADGPITRLGYTKIMRTNMVESEFALDEGAIKPLSPGYYSLGQSFTYYEQFADLPDSMGRRLLFALRDVVISPKRLERAQTDFVFRTSLLREPRALRAQEDAPRLFLRRSQNSHSKFPLEFAAELRIGDSQVGLQFDFSPVYKNVSSRIVALVGDNGAGKSALLAALSTALLSPDQSPSSIFPIDNPKTKDRRLLTESDPNTRRDSVAFARVIAISYGVFDAQVVPQTQETQAEVGDKQAARRYFYRGLKRWSTDGYALKEVAEIEAEFWSACESISDVARRKALKRALERLAQVTEIDRLTLDSILSKSRHKSGFSRLSSGQQVALNILVSLIAYLEPGSLVLIDEPEVHLHPPLVSALMRGIADSLSQFESVAVLATHSSVVIQELPARNVRVIRRAGDVTTSSHPEIETFGESLGAIERHVFGMNGVRGEFVNILETLNAGQRRYFADALGGGLSDQALAIALQAEALRE